jgi:hypothetical protein
MGRGCRLKVASNKEKAAKEDQEKALIENQEFITMRVIATAWPTPSTKEEELQDMADQGVIQEMNLTDWRAPGEHWVPYLNPGELSYSFLSFVLVCAFLLLLFCIASFIILTFL